MAKFDISPVSGADKSCWSAILTVEDFSRANDEPTPQSRYVVDSTRTGIPRQGFATWFRGITSPHVYGMCTILGAFFVFCGSARADPAQSPRPSPTTLRPDPPLRSRPPVVGPSGFAPSSILDGVYVWLGPTGSLARVEGATDSSIGVAAAIVRVRESAAIGMIGIAAGASLWTARDGGRVWVDGVVGTRLGRMAGVSVGPLIELGDLHHPRIGGSIGVWAFLGVTPYARVGAIQDGGGFAEVGLHIAFPIFRR